MAKKCSALWRERLKPAMVSNGLTQTELYKKAGISSVTLYKLKYGLAKNVYIETLRKLGEALGINADILAGYFNEGID